MTDNLREPVRDDNVLDAVQETVRPVPSSEDRGGSSAQGGRSRGQGGGSSEDGGGSSVDRGASGEHGGGSSGQGGASRGQGRSSEESGARVTELGETSREQEGTPMEHGGASRGQDDSPMEHGGALRGQDGTPMEHGSGPRWQEGTPMEHGGASRGQDDSPMEHAGALRGQEGTPMEHGGASREHSSGASGPGGTEGPSGLPKELGGGPTDPGGAPDNASAVHEPRDALQLIIDVILNPQAAFGYLGRRRHVGLAFLLAIAGSIVMTTASGPVSVVDDFVDTSPGPGFLLFSAVLTGTIGLLVSSAFTHITARLLGGKNRYVFMLQAVGFTFLPYLLAAPFFVVHRVVDIHFIVRGVWFIANVWTLILYVLAIREVHNLSTGRAIAAFAIPFMLLFGLVFTITLFVLGALMWNF